MKKSIFALFLIVAVGAGAAFAQTKKRVVRKTTRGAATKKTPVRQATVKTAVGQQAVTTASGLTYIVTKRGDGAPIKAGDNVVVNYTGLLTNGTKFDSSLDRGDTFSFQVGAGRVIKGWDEGLQRLRVGDHATLIIPASIGYGARGAGGVIPPDATLIFLIEVIGVK
ncbi:MAG TPA: FKBP-type peptidyl-prolyl cis-trans isomerase [Pyrinomonadaceae bacterium]|jgi:FKBP-type peptidyl-prolyl cis-trans isomerase